MAGSIRTKPSGDRERKTNMTNIGGCAPRSRNTE
jgi:hypothetical protein